MSANHKRLLPRPNQKTEIPVETSPVIRERTPTPEKCRLEYYQKPLLSYTEIKGKICELYFREESKSTYVQEILKASQRKFGKGTKYEGEKYCDVIKKDKRFIAGLLQKDYVKPDINNQRYYK